jgi:hypothetical protein
MPVPEFRQWQAYAALYPIGPAREDWRIGQLAALYFNAKRGKDQAPARVSDFMWEPPQEHDDVDDETEQLMTFLSSLPSPPNLN